MKKLLSIISIGFIIASCGKANVYTSDFSTAVFINASPGSPILSVYVDTISQVTVAFKSTSGYLSVKPGTRNIQLKNSTNLTVNNVNSPSETFATNTAYTYFVYDTITATTNNLKTLRLSDQFTLPAAGSIKVRVLPLAIKQSAVDITFLRTSATPNDSVTLSNLSYVGASPAQATIDALSAFTTIPAGAYSVKVKTAGTQTVLVTGTYTLANLTGSGNTYGINTFYLAGTAMGQALSLNVFRNHPYP